ncbi:MAG TPA: hypothetical protein VLA42_15640 [Verrucomicrobiae bacterium]|jgi:hypothetical protein|nr:hypothetical protein [Verrucomicrobiae bacterium]
MKIQNILRTQVAVIGFAAAFLLAGGARAQEIDNTVWEDSSNVERFPQPAPAAVANNGNAVMANPVETDTATVVAQSSVVREAVVSGGTAREGWLIAMSIMLMAPVAVLLLAKVRRAKQNIQARAYHSKRSAALT